MRGQCLDDRSGAGVGKQRPVRRLGVQGPAAHRAGDTGRQPPDAVRAASHGVGERQVGDPRERSRELGRDELGAGLAGSAGRGQGDDHLGPPTQLAEREPGAQGEVGTGDQNR